MIVGLAPGILTVVSALTVAGLATVVVDSSAVTLLQRTCRRTCSRGCSASSRAR